MIRFATILVTTLLCLGCASGQRPPELLQPQVEIRQVGGADGSGVTRNYVGGMPVRLQIAVMNPSLETIEVEMIEIASVGMGGFNVPVTKRPFDRRIPPEGFEILDFWTAAYAEDTVAGTGGPVTLRLTVFFESEFGKFREVYTQNINTSTRPRQQPR